MSVKVSIRDLIYAKVVKIHFSKNIILKNFGVFNIINQLQKANLTKKLDIERVKYDNGGYALHFFSNNYEIVFYDKMKKMRMSRSKALEDNNKIQFGIPDKFDKDVDILRMELRFSNKNTIENKLKKAGVDSKSIFNLMFDSNISKKILQYFFSEILKNLPVCQINNEKPEEIFLNILKNNKGIKFTTAINIFGLKTLIDTIGARGTREIISKGFSDKNWYRTWERYNSYCKNFKLTSLENSYNILLQIENSLNNFIPLNLDSLTFNTSSV